MKISINFKLIKKDQNGAIAVLTSVLIMSAILTVAMAASAVIQNGIIMGRNQIHSTKAYFAAEAGLERLLYEVRKDGFNVSTCNSAINKHANLSSGFCQNIPINNPPLSLATYNIEYRDYDPILFPDSTVSFYSLGDFLQVRRAVEVTY